MMTQEEWLKQFEQKNGRLPSQEEFSQAWQAGAFIADQSVGETKPKSKVALIIGLVIGAFAILFLSVGMYVYFLYNAGNINGQWESRQVEKMMKASIDNEFSDLSGYGLKMSDYIGTPEVTMIGKSDQVVLDVSFTVDADKLSKLLSDKIEEQLKGSIDGLSQSHGLTDEEKKALLEEYQKNYQLTIPTQSQIKTMLDKEFRRSATKQGLSYNSKTGVISTKVFEGKVDRFGKVIRLTHLHKVAYLNNVKKDDGIFFEKQGNRLILKSKGEKDIIFTRKTTGKADV